MQSNIIKIVKQSWGWTGIQPQKVILENDFGNLIIEDTKLQYWRLCPEDTYCEIIVQDSKELNKLLENKEFSLDWNMQNLIDIAKDKLGLLPPGNKYHLIIPGFVGGKYDISNIKIISQIEQIRFSGNFAQQINDMPDGTKIKIEII